MFRRTFMERKSGVLMHISSLYGDYSSGGFGKSAFSFIDFLKDCGFSYWQVLPFNPVDECNSPYKSASTFALNPYFADIDSLFEQGLITEEERRASVQKTPYYCEYDRLKKERLALLKKAASRADGDLSKSVEDFIKARPYIRDYCEFAALKEANGEKPWTEWTEVSFDKDEFFAQCFIQYELFYQWQKIKSYANKNGIKIIGDIPIYVSFDSADVYFNKELFCADENGRLSLVAGVPPDYFSADGQLWGNPLYNWEKMEKDGFSWWRERLNNALSLFDGVRIDHFRGFESFWAVPASEKTAKNGSWKKGPGMKLINVLKKTAGEKLIIAEDLGDITEDVIKLVNDSGFPGMRVFQFGFLGGESVHKPHNYINNCVAYSGTHDNNTLLGYLWEMPLDTKRDVMNYCSCDPEKWNENGCRAIVKTILASSAGLAIFPIQDLLGYGSDTRLNVPGRAYGNWLYRITKEQLGFINKDELRYYNALYGRI